MISMCSSPRKPQRNPNPSAVEDSGSKKNEASFSRSFSSDYGSRLRLQHWDNARKQGDTAARNLLGGKEPYVRTPYLYSDQFDLGMEYAGHAPSWDRVVFRGDPASRAFIAFWLQDGRVVAGMNANIWKVNDAIVALVASRRPVDVEGLVDPAVPLDDLDTLLRGRQLATA